MDDIFDDRPAEVRPHVDTHKLVVEARAELNSIEKSDDASLVLRREIGRKFKEIIDAMGRGGAAFIAKHTKISESFVRGHVELFESPECIDRAESMAILWGHKSRLKGSGTAKPTPKHNPKSQWKGFNQLDRHARILADEKGKPEEYKRVKEHLAAIDKILTALEK